MIFSRAYHAMPVFATLRMLSARMSYAAPFATQE